MNQRTQLAIEAVARRFSATWQAGARPAQGHLTVRGKRIGLEVATLKVQRGVRGAPTKLHLRFDKVVLRLIGRLRAALSEEVPAGRTVIVTVTAPIRVPGKTAAELEERIRALLRHRSARAQLAETIHGNQVRVGLLKAGSPRTSKLIGFVHNRDSDPRILFDVTQSLLACIGAQAGGRADWLVLVEEGGRAHIDTYQQVYSQLSAQTGFKSILIVLADGRVETLDPPR